MPSAPSTVVGPPDLPAPRHEVSATRPAYPRRPTGRHTERKSHVPVLPSWPRRRCVPARRHEPHGLRCRRRRLQRSRGGRQRRDQARRRRLPDAARQDPRVRRQANLAAEAGLDLEIKSFDDYVQPNVQLAEGTLDANYFQHLPYYEAQVKDRGYEFAHYDGVHIEPFALYSKKVKDVSELAEGAQVGINNDPSNQGRALELLAKAGVITLKAGKDATNATIYDIDQNTKKLPVHRDRPGAARALARRPRRRRDQRQLRARGRPVADQGRDPRRGGRGQPLRQLPHGAEEGRETTRRSRSSTSCCTRPRSRPTSRRPGPTARCSPAPA